MEYYANVKFQSDQIEQQRNFLLAMNNVGVIQMTREDIDDLYRNSVWYINGFDNILVLHSEEEKDRFESVMKIFFKDIPYKITNEPEGEGFKNWLENKNKKMEVTM